MTGGNHDVGTKQVLWPQPVSLKNRNQKEEAVLARTVRNTDMKRLWRLCRPWAYHDPWEIYNARCTTLRRYGNDEALNTMANDDINLVEKCHIAASSSIAKWPFCVQSVAERSRDLCACACKASDRWIRQSYPTTARWMERSSMVSWSTTIGRCTLYRIHSGNQFVNGPINFVSPQLLRVARNVRSCFCSGTLSNTISEKSINIIGLHGRKQLLNTNYKLCARTRRL